MTRKSLGPSFTDEAFIPATAEAVKKRGWSGLDVILVTGDALIDCPQIGVAVIARVLLAAGYRVGVISQPDVSSDADIGRLGEPALFWGVTGGCVDSMVANYTASGKRRRSDDMTPGGENRKRPDRALIAYTNLIRRYFKNTRPIVLGGIEASLRRISHYDAWTDSVRRSVLFDAKGDCLLYGMAEESVLELAQTLSEGRRLDAVRGLCFIQKDIPAPTPAFPRPDAILPDHDTVTRDPEAFERMFRVFYDNADPVTACRLIQRQDTRYLIHNPPAPALSSAALDRVHGLFFTRRVHPVHEGEGPVKAIETIRFSITSHRGCYGECRFCAIAVHQGRKVVSRTEAAIIREAEGFTRHPDFKGVISDVGGPTANMYGFECPIKETKGACRDKSCLFPESCKGLGIDHGPQIRLLTALRQVPGIKKVFVASGVRHDLVLRDKKNGLKYLQKLLAHHVSGQLKIAPEHVAPRVLHLMGKPGAETLEAFIRAFERVRAALGKGSFLTYYLMAAHPGCTWKDMETLRRFCRERLHLLPEQVQIFTPTPSTWSTLMYHTQKDPFSGEPIFVEKETRSRECQKRALERRDRPDVHPVKQKP